MVMGCGVSRSASLRDARRIVVCGVFAVLLGSACGDDDDGLGDHGDDQGDADSGHDEAPAGDSGEDHDQDPSQPIGTPSGATCPEDSTLSYETFGKTFMDKYCVRCHSSKLEGETARMGAPPGHDFDVFEGIIGVAEHADQYAAKGPDSTNTMMPPSGARPTAEEREKLGQWLACELEMLE